LIVILIACFLLYIFLKKLNPNINNEFLISKKLINNDSKEKKGKIPNEYDSLLAYQDKPKQNDELFQNNKIVKFSLDYCRASPNMNLKNKNLLNIGWRMNKYNFSINYDVSNYSGEKSRVFK
jgi:hypothetical protein